MIVVPHRGVDDIRLGSSKDVVAGCLGDPDKKQIDQHTETECSEIWFYRLLRLEMSFDSEHEYVLSHITSYHPYAFVNGFNPIGLEEKYLLQKFPHLHVDLEVKKDEKYYSDRILNLTYEIRNSKVVSVTIFPETEPITNKILWPSVKMS